MKRGWYVMYEALNTMRRNAVEKNQQILAHFKKIT